MGKNNKDISEIKFEVLVDAISAIDISDVDAKETGEDNIALYISTSNIDTVNKEKLSEICDKYSSEDFDVKFLIPENKVIENKLIPNTDCVCIFIQKN